MHKTLKLFVAVLISSFFGMTGFAANAAQTTPRRLGFAWDAAAGTNLDLSGHGFSSVGISAELGLKWKWIRFFGIGAEGDMNVSSSGRIYPIFANFRTDFSNSHKLAFFDLRGGISLNYLYDYQHTGAYFSAGVGVTLAKGKSFSSHVILAYTYVSQDKCYDGEYLRKCPGISMATLRLGVSFTTASTPRPGIPPMDFSKAKRVIPEPTYTEDIPDFINLSAMEIIIPDSQRERWKKLAEDMISANEGPENRIEIMHIGDSHIQAEMGTSQTRRILQDVFGNGGRGLITAFKLAGTNQPVDYAITSQNPVDSQTRLLKRPWDITPGFTGIASLSNRSNKITFKNLREDHKFNRARIFTSDGERLVLYPEITDSAQFIAFPGEKVYGVYTDNRHKGGIVYSTIGNNGACYSDYLLIEGFPEQIATFNPSLIILSMGTNEGFSSKTDKEIAAETKKLIRDLRKTNPEAVFLLWTPMESEGKNSEGTFEVKKRVKDASKVMKQVALDEDIAYWDFYDVAGGNGAAQAWLEKDLMNPKDHVHLLGKGYRLQGELAAKALIDALNRALNF